MPCKNKRTPPPRIAAALARRAGQDAEAGQIAEAVCAALSEIDAALSPILGSRGVAALYTRSLYLTAVGLPWMAHLAEGSRDDMDLPALKSVFAQQSGADAAAGGNALLQAFHRLLASLIGDSLTERLLRPVWADPSSGAPAQDTSP